MIESFAIAASLILGYCAARSGGSAIVKRLPARRKPAAEVAAYERLHYGPRGRPAPPAPPACDCGGCRRGYLRATEAYRAEGRQAQWWRQ